MAVAAIAYVLRKCHIADNSFASCRIRQCSSRFRTGRWAGSSPMWILWIITLKSTVLPLCPSVDPGL